MTELEYVTHQIGLSSPQRTRRCLHVEQPFLLLRCGRRCLWPPICIGSIIQ